MVINEKFKTQDTVRKIGVRYYSITEAGIITGIQTHPITNYEIYRIIWADETVTHERGTDIIPYVI